MAAVYLARYQRRAVVIDAGESRVVMIPKSRNVLGFPDGIAGPELMSRMREHAANYGVRMETARVGRIEMAGDGFEAVTGDAVFRAPFVILATGATDVEPDVTGLAESLKSGHVRYCPVCDGFETKGRKVAVFGRDLHALRESAFVAGFDNEVTWLSLGTHTRCEEKELERLRAANVTIVEHEPHHIHCDPETGIEIEMKSGERLKFDVLYPALGLTHHSELAKALGAKLEADGQLVVSDHFETTVPGLFAAGDVAAGLNQINVAAGQAAIAATEIHNRLL